MARDSEKRRAWVKNAAIIFLVVLLLLTFFSNTILNYSLPEVSAQYAGYGTLSNSIKADGTVKANESYRVVYEADQAEADDGVVQSRSVVSVYVKEGDFVEKDAPILELKGGASDQLKQAQEEYEAKKQEYDLALLDDTVAGLELNQTMTEAKKTLARAQEELADLQKEHAALLNGADTTAILENRKETIQEELASLEERVADAQKRVADTEAKISQAEGMVEEDILSDLTVAEKLAEAEETYEKLDAEYKDLARQVEFYKETLEKLKDSAGDITEASRLHKELDTLRDAYYEDCKQYTRHYEDYALEIVSLLKQMDGAKDNEDVKAVLEDVLKGKHHDHLEMAEYQVQQYGDSKYQVDDVLRDFFRGSKQADNMSVVVGDAEIGTEEGMSDDQLLEQIESLTRTYDRAATDAWEVAADKENQIADIKVKLRGLDAGYVDEDDEYQTNRDIEQAQKDFERASADYADVQTKYEAAKANLESLRKQNIAEGTASEYKVLLEEYKTELRDLQELQKQKNKELAAVDKELQKTDAPRDPETVADEIKTKQDSIESLQAQLKITEANQNKTQTSNQMTREQQKAELEALAAKIETYKNAPETTSVTAPIAGRIVSVECVPGGTVSSGDAVASIEIADKGYVCEITMPVEQARRIQVGTPCTIANSWWYSDIEASVTQVRSDPTSQGKNRIIVITVKGDVYEGQTLKFAIGDKSQSYDSVLPNSAIREDNDGKFVLVVDSKNSPLGTRYTARRVDIEIVASDDTQSAVSGLFGSEFVVTNSTVPIADKQRVRLADNG